jgi:enamine deaminase RidA (YjgF/YER057c/UK114 family)
MGELVRRRLSPKALPPGRDRERGYAYGVQVGNTVWIGGQVPYDETATLVGEGDPRAQADQCLKNIAAVLAEAGGTLDDVVQLNVYVRSTEYYKPVREARLNAFRDPNYPALVVIAGNEFAQPEFLVEMHAIAVVEGLTP